MQHFARGWLVRSVISHIDFILFNKEAPNAIYVLKGNYLVWNS